MTKPPKVKRLFWDIETSPNVMYSWRAGFKLNLGPDLIIKERKVICICYKWEGEDTVYSLTWDEDQDDKKMLQDFVEVAAQADEMIAHYGDGFDMPWFRTRCLIHGLTPLPAYKTVDTKAWASKYFYFNSNKLDYLGGILVGQKKLHTEWSLWEKVMAGVKSALDYMVKYCKIDVVLLEKIWTKLRFCVAPKTHSGVFSGHDRWSCPHCSSEDVTKSKTRITASGTTQHQMRCHATKCNAFYTISDPTFKDYVKAKAPVSRPPKAQGAGAGKRPPRVAAR